MPDASLDRRLTLHLPRSATMALRLLCVAVVVVALHTGRDLLLPLALAALLAFLLDPAVSWMQRRRVPRRLAVGVAAGLTLVAVAAASFVIAQQVVQVGRDLPRYHSTIEKKLRQLRAGVTGDRTLSSATRLIGTVEAEVDKARQALQPAAPSPQGGKAEPLRVQLASAEVTSLRALRDLTRPLLEPLLKAGVVFVLLVFILLERNDIRDRLLRLSGRDLPDMTDALNEAASRVSRYLRLALMLNVAYGLPLALGLWAIGVPGAWLWGALAALLRFVPYLGPVVASLFPLAVAFAVDPGWDMLLWTAALLLTLELVSNNVVEPWVYGPGVGLAPMAVLLSAGFWTVLWGPAGLVLATPLTVCLVVVGRQLPALRFLEVLLGSTPAFDGPTRLFQRLLSGKVEASLEEAGQQITRSGVLAFYSDTALPALAKAGGHASELATAEHRHRVRAGMAALLRELRQEHPASVGDTPRVQWIGLRWEVDQLAAEMAVHALQLLEVPAEVLPASALAHDRGEPGSRGLVCLSTFHRNPEALVRHACARLRRRHPQLRIVLGLWNAPEALREPGAAARLGVEAVATTLDEAVQRVAALLGVALDAAPAAAAAPPASAGQDDAAARCRRTPFAERALRATPVMQRATEVFDAEHALVLWADGHQQLWPALPGATPPDTAWLPALLMGPVTGARQPLVIPDAARDVRMGGAGPSPLLVHRFVAAVPVAAPGAPALGALCVLGSQPREFSPAEQTVLETLGIELARAIEQDRDEPRRVPPGPEPAAALLAPRP